MNGSDKLLLAFAVVSVFIGVSCGEQAGQDRPESESSRLRSASLRVIGMTYLGNKGSKEVSLIHTEDRYVVRYSCHTKGPGFKCGCRNEEKEVGKQAVDQFLKVVENLKDQGENAECCDHPWTEIKLDYLDGSSKKIKVALEPVEVEKIFHLDCGKSPTD